MNRCKTKIHETDYGICVKCGMEVPFCYQCQLTKKGCGCEEVKKPVNSTRLIDSKLRHEAFRRDGYRCVECGAGKESILHADHIIPLSKGGTDELSNIQTLCAQCNIAKGSNSWKTDNEYMS